MRTTLIFILITLFTGCSFFEKHEGSSDLQNLTKQVLDEDQGISIEVKPINVPKE